METGQLAGIMDAAKKVQEAKAAGTPITTTEVNTNTSESIVAAAKAAQTKAAEDVAATQTTQTANAETTQGVDSSLTIETTPAATTTATEATHTETTPATTKSFDEELSERFEGKYKSVDELQAALAPKPSEIANDYIAKLNELAKQGVEFNEEFWSLQSKDFKSMTDPDAILLEAMRLNPDYKGWSDKLLKLELENKYKKKEWSEEGDEPTDTEILARAHRDRDAETARNGLIQKQESYSVKQSKPSQAEIDAANQKAAAAQAKWEQFVETDVLSKGTKLSTLIDDKTNEVFDYTISDSDKKEIGAIMKQLPTNIDAFWSEFKNDKGEYDYKEIYDLLALKRNKNNLIKVVAQNYRAKGAEAEVKNLKNINFKPDGTQVITTKTVDQKNSESAVKTLQSAGILKK